MPPGNSQSFKVEVDFVAKNKDLFDKANKEAAATAQSAKAIKNAYELYRGELQKLNPELVKTLDLQKQQAQALDKSKQAASELTARIRNMRAEAKEIRTSVALLKDSADDLDRVAKPLFAGGAAIVGGIFAFANKYVNDAKESTQATREWKAAQDDLNKSGQRIGEVLATEALPVLKQAANVTRQIAGFLERNPEAASAVLNAGLIALTLGAIGKAVTSGIRLVADLRLDAALTLQNRAAQLQLLASENQLKAAGIQAQSSSVPGPSAAGGGGLLNLLKLAGAITVAAPGTLKLGQEGIGFGVRSGERFQQALVNMGVISEETAEKLDTARDSAYDFAKSIPVIGGLFSQVGDDIVDKAKEISNALPTQSFLGGSQENQDKAVQAFAEFRAEENRITRDAMETRKQIIAEGEKQIVDITRQYSIQRKSIETQYSDAAKAITTRYQADVKKAEQDYQEERAQIAQDGNERIREIQQQEQEKREEIEREFAKASRSATADRDALALVQAQEARDEALAEADRGTSEAIQRERRETQERLQELATRYAQERQQRQAQYEADLKENAARRAAALKEANERYQQELKQAREANAQKLKEAAEAANKERIEKRNQFIAQLQDLGVTLNSERQLRNTAYNAMLSDLQNWLNQMGGVVSSQSSSITSNDSATGGSTTTLNTNPNFSGSGQYGTHDYSGYAYTGIYKMAQDGKPQWVMSGDETRALERSVGGQLTQGSMAQMLSLFGNLRGNVNYSPNINSDVSVNTRREMEESFNRSLDRMMGGY